MSDLNDLTPTQRMRFDRWQAWQHRMTDLDTPLNEEEVEKLMVDLRNRNASHKKYLVPTYQWAKDCPHDTDHLEEFSELYVGDIIGTDRNDIDEHHQRDEDGELFCLLSPLEPICICGDGHCDRLAELNGAAEDFWASHTARTETP